MSSELYIPDEYDLQRFVSGDEIGYEIGYDDDDDDDVGYEVWSPDGEPLGVVSGTEIGARRRRRGGRSRGRGAMRAMPAAVRRALSRRAPVALASSPIPTAASRVIQNTPVMDGYSVLPLDSVIAIPAGTTAIISAQVQQLFKPMSIQFDPVVSPDFTVTSIKCGIKEQLAGNGAMPASFFSAENAYGQLNLETIDAALSLNITVQNISGAPRILRGGCSGFKAR